VFLDVLTRRNPRLIDAAITLHQQGRLPANTYAFDLDMVRDNAATIATTAAELNLTVFAMTKQVGRNPDLCRSLIDGGIPASVNVDLECARATARAGMQIGHIGHLVQIPRAEADAAQALQPAYWTVFNLDKALEAARSAKILGREQAVLARIYGPEDNFYPGHEGGFPVCDIGEVADAIDAIDGARFAGITTFPALLFDQSTRRVVPTHNLSTLHSAAELLRAAGRSDLQMNGPGTNSTAVFAALAATGVTQVEPGHALTGTTPWHAIENLPELPAVCYVSEVSHLYQGRAYCFGGGLYVDPVFPPYQLRAVVGRDPADTALVEATVPSPAAIDYYGQLNLTDHPQITVGDTVVFGFRIQAFVTRAYTAGIAGLAAGEPVVEGIWSSDGSANSWPN